MPDELFGSVNAGSAVGYLKLDTSDFNRGFDGAFARIGQFTAESGTIGQKISVAGSALNSVGRTLTMTVTAPLLGAGFAAVSTAANFQKAMSDVSAVAGATGEDFIKLKEKAQDVGASTIFSATESAQALKYMAMAGWNTQQMLDGLDGVALLAAATGEELANTSDIVTNSLTAFGLSAKDTTQFVDVLAMAANASNTGVSELGESFKYVAPLAGTLKYSIQDMATALGIMANNGIKGSQAGTSLRAALSRMAKPTDATAGYLAKLGLYANNTNLAFTNSDGTIKKFSETVSILRDKFAKLTDAQKTEYAAQLFGQEAMSGMLSIINSSESDYAKLADQINNAAGTTQKMADVMQDNLGGAMELLKGSLGDLGIAFGDMMIPKITEIVKKVTEWIDKFNSLDDGTKKLILDIALVVAAAGPVLTLVGSLTSGVGSLITTFTELAAGTLGATGWFGLALAAAGLLAAGIAILVTKHRELYSSVYDIRDAVNENTDVFNNAKIAYDDNIAKITATADVANNFINRLKELESQQKLTSDEQLEYSGIVMRLQELFPEFNIQLDTNTGLLKDGAQALKDQITGWEDLAVAEAMQEKVTEIIKANTDLLVKQQIARNELADAQAKNAANETEYSFVLDEVEKKLGLVSGSLAGMDKYALAEMVKNAALETPGLTEIYDKIVAIMEQSAIYDETISGLKTSIDDADVSIAAMRTEIDTTKTAMQEVATNIGNVATSANNLKIAGNDAGAGIAQSFASSSNDVTAKLSEMAAGMDKTKAKSDEVTNAIRDGNILMVRVVSEQLGQYTSKNDEELTSVELKTKEKLENILKVYQDKSTVSADAYVQGLKTGMESGIPEIEAMARVMADAANEAFKGRLDINSPSRVMRKSAASIPEGIVMGMQDGLQAIKNTAKSLADASKISFDKNLDTDNKPFIKQSEVKSSALPNIDISVAVYPEKSDDEQDYYNVGVSLGRGLRDELRGRGINVV